LKLQNKGIAIHKRRRINMAVEKGTGVFEKMGAR